MNHLNKDGRLCRASQPKQRGRKPIYAEWPSDEICTAERDTLLSNLTHAQYFRALNDSDVGDRQPLRKLWTLSEREEVHITKLPRTAPELAKRLGKHKLHPVPKRYARQILICLGRLATKFGGLATLATEPVQDTIIHTLAAADVPAEYSTNLKRWLNMTPVIVEGHPNPASALAAETIKAYIESANTCLAAISGAGVELDPTVGIAFLVQKRAVRRWKQYIESRCKRTTLISPMAGLVRIAEDLKCPADDIASLKAKIGKLAKLELCLSADEKSKIASWIEPTKHRCLLSAPGELVGMADDITASRASRILNGAAGFALQLMYEHPSLDEFWITNCDLRSDIREFEGSLCVIGPVEAEPVSAGIADLHARVFEQRKQMRVASTLLLPGKDGLAREVRSAMEAIYTCVQSILGERVKCTDLRDINTSMAEDAPDNDVSETAAGAGYKHTRSLARRLGRVAAPNKRRRRKS